MVAILKDQNNRIWKDTSGRILKSAPFNQQVLQSGLSFWGVSDPNFMTLVSDKISELYDFRDTGKTGVTYGKMVQDTDANRPVFNGIEINFQNDWITHNFTTSAYTFFIVSKNGGRSGIGVASSGSENYFLGTNDSGNISLNKDSISYSNKYFYKNTTKSITPVSGSGVYNIAHSLDLFLQIGNISVGLMRTISGTNYDVKEFGWYNRVLSESEIVYNINALNAKYNIF